MAGRSALAGRLVPGPGAPHAIGQEVAAIHRSGMACAGTTAAAEALHGISRHWRGVETSKPRYRAAPLRA